MVREVIKFRQGRGDRRLGGSTDPSEIYLGVKHGILTPNFFGNIFSSANPHGIYIIVILYSETRSRTVFVIILTDLWTSRSVALMISIFAPPPVKNGSREPEFRPKMYYNSKTGPSCRLQSSW